MSKLQFFEEESAGNQPDTVVFEDETDRTAANYHVVPVDTFEPSPAAQVEQQSPSPPLSLGTPLSPTGLLLLDSSQNLNGTDSGSDSDSGFDSALLPAETLVAKPKLGNPDEALLLRHFQKTIGPWVRCFILARRPFLPRVEPANT